MKCATCPWRPGTGTTFCLDVRLGALTLAVLLWSLAAVSPAWAAARTDPYLRWYTLVTPHFRLHYHSGLEEIAQSAASAAEWSYERITRDLGWRPPEITEVLLTDDTDAANGSARVLPYSLVRLYVTAPDDMSALQGYHDWLLDLVTHEFTHVAHLDNVTGLPAVLNAILGKTVAPNALQPPWLVEGVAVNMESAYTGRGRLRSSLYDMYLRADVLEGRLARLDEIGNPVRRWPSGELPYLYGSEFVRFIRDVYGPTVFAAVAADYGDDVIPWAINRAVRRVTGKTYVELYRDWQAHLQQRYAAQVSAIVRRGRREGTRLTHGGRGASTPRFVPERCRSRWGVDDAFVFYRDDGHTFAGLYVVPFVSRQRVDETRAVLLARTDAPAASFDPACGIVFAGTALSRRNYLFSDLQYLPPGARSPQGTERWRRRLTVGRRALMPDVSPDGRSVVYVANHAGTTTLRIADRSPDGTLTHERLLAPSGRFEQVYTPRFSPDGRTVAYGVWTRDGYRDLRVVDVRTGSVSQLTRDRALDLQPSWSPDGRFLFFSSDRTGVPNVYAFDFSTLELYQVTNVLTGAYMPEVAPDGRTLLYVGYTSEGFDVYSLELDQRQWLAALPYRDPYPVAEAGPAPRRWPVRPYNPLPTLRPYAYNVEYGSTTYGQGVRVSARGSDAVGLHLLHGSVTAHTELGGPEFSLDYTYRRLPLVLSAELSRSAAPTTGFTLDTDTHRITQWRTAASTWISVPRYYAYESQNLWLGYSLVEHHARLPVGENVDPYASVPVEPDRGVLGEVNVGWAYSNASGTWYGIGPERGWSSIVALDLADEATASDSALVSLMGRARAYVPMPWLDHHVLALAVSGGASVGDFPRQGRLFYVGGFMSQDLAQTFVSSVRQGAFVLRGYAPNAFGGTEYTLLNAEYRFPLLSVDRGASTLPVFLRFLSGALFADYGGAFDRLDTERPLESYHLGLGGELRVDWVFAFGAEALLRLGYAVGTDSTAVRGGQSYFAAAADF
ncbi:MAG: PD40 domain-containing protein [Polyangiaceae bacterium]|nr:PD40 domain-containing protein [Polyangiaceae bacterium]